jgi:hypothetical protein
LVSEGATGCSGGFVDAFFFICSCGSMNSVYQEYVIQSTVYAKSNLCCTRTGDQ